MGQSAFFGIGIGTQGLYTAKTALDITSHNIANAETEGFSRQYGVQSASKPLSNGSRGMLGTGSEITDVKQYRDAYLDSKYWSMSNKMGEYETKSDVLNQIELIFNEPSDSGYSTFFGNIFENLNELSTNPGDSTVRSNFVGSLDSFAGYMQDLGGQLTELQREVNFGLKTNVDQLNFFAQQIATLNGQIGDIELSGSSANDLRDERNRLIDELSEVVNVDTNETTDINGKTKLSISINGQILVQDRIANYLEVKTRDTKNNPEDYVSMYDIYWETGKELYLDNSNISGELKGYIDLRDGNNGENFKGDVTSVPDTTHVVVENPSRTDLPKIGELVLDGQLIKYNDYDYTPASDGPPVVAESMNFFIGTRASVGDQGSMEDVNGDSFTDVVTSVSAGQDQITFANSSDQDLPSSGTINLDGTLVTYTGYSKAIPPGTEITLNIEAPATSVGTDTYIGDEMPFKGIPYYEAQLNEFVRTIAKEFNAINEMGQSQGVSGTQLFTFEGSTEASAQALDTESDFSYEQITVHNIQVNQELIDNLDLLETSSAVNPGESANDLVLKFMNLRHDADMFERGEPDNFMQALIGEVGIDANQISSFKDGQERLLVMVDNQRLSISGVDLNEETANMLKYQQAYNVAAKIISVMDEIYDTTINRMGL